MDEQIVEIYETTPKDNVYINLIEQSLEGVMFHNYNIDLFDVLGLEGFKKLHACQYKEEGQALAELKHYYIMKFHKLPLLQVKAPLLWRETYENVSKEELPSIVRKALADYYTWESGVLEHLLSWRKDAQDKKMFHDKIKDVMYEIEHLEILMDILNKHDYDYECICEVSNYLYYQ